jgi:hypothetical protein
MPVAKRVSAFRAEAMSWEQLHHVSGFLVDCTLLAAAVMAVIRFRLFNVLGHRWRSDLVCTHWDQDDGSVIFTADYTLQNTGQRPLQLRAVSLTLVGATLEGSLLAPDANRALAQRILRSEDPTLQGLFQIEPGERAIYTLRCRLDSLDDVVFVLCGFDLKQRRVPAAYRGFYCRSPPAHTTGATGISTPSVQATAVSSISRLAGTLGLED